jgi:predicted N-acyltransferase
MQNSSLRTLKNSEFSYVLIDSILEIPAKEWDAVNVKNNIYLSHDYLSGFEAGMKQQVDIKYLIFYTKQSEIMGVCALQILYFKPKELLQDRIPVSIANKVKLFFSDHKTVSLLICGNLFACGENGFAHADFIERAPFLKLVSKTLHELFKGSERNPKISFALLKEFWTENNETNELLKKENFIEFGIDVNMVLYLKKEWETFDHYLNNMNTKYRTRAKNVFKKSENLEKRDFSESQIESYLLEIDKMYVEILKKVDYNLGILKAETFVELKKKLKNQFVFTAYYLDEVFVGFSTAFVFGAICDANFIGIDYSYNKNHKLYQRMLYDYVEMSIQRECKELRLGRTAETIKSVVGAKPVPMKLFARHRNCIPTKLLRLVLGAIKPVSYEIRSPFKI